MNDDDRDQQTIHAALEAALGEITEMDGALTGWVIFYERVTADGEAHASRIYGPAGMTTWRALGLVEYMRDGFISAEDES